MTGIFNTLITLANLRRGANSRATNSRATSRRGRQQAEGAAQQQLWRQDTCIQHIRGWCKRARKSHSTENDINKPIIIIILMKFIKLLSILNWYPPVDCTKSFEVRAVFIDISKAFDKVWYEGLDFNLEQNGTSGSPLKLFQNYLINIIQCVVLNGSFSEYSSTPGVPPTVLFFVLYYS